MASETVEKLKRLQAATHALFDEQTLIERGEHRASRLQRFAHFWLLAGRSFIQNRCAVRASALAYTTLLALIPLLAVVVGVTTSLLKKEGEEPVRRLIDNLVASVAPQLDLVSPQGEAAQKRGREQVVGEITRFITNVQSGALGVTGTVALVVIAISLISTIEVTFNDIWGSTRGRSWTARVVNYWTAITLGPLILVLAIAITSGPHFAATQRLLSKIPLIGSLLFYLLPFVLLSVTFALFYQFMPNTRVEWKAALVGGAVGGCLWQLNNMFNVLYVSRVVTYTNIYGSLALVPVFLVGLYFSWLILLFGAQVAYSYQNRRAYLQERQAQIVNQRSREALGLRLMTLSAQRFQQGAPPPSGRELAEALGVSTRLIGQLLMTLVRAGLLLEVAGREPTYAPARPLDQISAQDILEALRAGNGHELLTRDDPLKPIVQSQLETIQAAERAAAAAVTLQRLVGGPHPAAGGTGSGRG
jgi:membrane protein